MAKTKEKKPKDQDKEIKQPDDNIKRSTRSTNQKEKGFYTFKNMLTRNVKNQVASPSVTKMKIIPKNTVSSTKSLNGEHSLN